MAPKKNIENNINKRKYIKKKKVQLIEEVIETNEEVQLIQEVIEKNEEVQLIEEVIEKNEEVQLIQEVIEKNEEVQLIQEVIDKNEEVQLIQEVIETNEEVTKINQNIEFDIIKDMNQIINQEIDIQNINYNTEIILDNIYNTKNNIIENLINSNIEYTLNDNQIKNILHENNVNQYYSLNNLLKIFNKISEGVLIIQIIDNKIKFIEKKGYESRNQSIIDLIIKTNNYKKLPNIQFIIYTNDLLKDTFNDELLYTFSKNNIHNTMLFPNFNFNHWMESNIDKYTTVYNNFINSQIKWSEKKDIIFWSGADTNIIRKKIYNSTINNSKFYINILNKDKNNYIAIGDIIKYKYLLNMNGYSYGGRLNYLFLSGSCVIILKNKNIKYCYEEFFYKYFIPNEDYLEIIYDDNEDTSNIVNKIENSILNNNCELIAKKCFEKAKYIFQINNIYDYIYDSLSELSKKNKIKNILEKTICYTPENLKNYYFKDRLEIINNKIDFMFKGTDLEILLYDNEKNIIHIKISIMDTNIIYNDNNIFFKYTPYILNQTKNQKYEFFIHENYLTITIENKFTLIKCEIPKKHFIINNTKIRTELGGWWII